jgi:plasmid maintenance system antidote protein VapI
MSIKADVVMAEKQFALINAIMDENGIRNYAQLSRSLGVAPPVISKHINGELRIGDNMILRLHETFGVPVARIRAALA